MASAFQNRLQPFIFRFIKETGAIPYLGAELEFYLDQMDCSSPATCFPGKDNFLALCKGRGLAVERLDVESGQGQFEAVFAPTMDACALAQRILDFKALAEEFLAIYKVRPLFEAKPKPDDLGSGLHIHISLLDPKTQQNLFHKPSMASDETLIMKRALAGLLMTMPEAMRLFCPNPQALLRFEAHVSIPARMCWGGNNRTVALRLPDCTAFPESRRVEHRVGSAEADPYAVILAILAGIHHGLVSQVPLGPKVHGNAFLSVYGEAPYSYPLFPQSFEEIERNYQEAKILKHYDLLIENDLLARQAMGEYCD